MSIYGVQRALLDGLSMVRLLAAPGRARPPQGFNIKPETSCGHYRNLE
jgi:hypothetical protein